MTWVIHFVVLSQESKIRKIYSHQRRGFKQIEKMKSKHISQLQEYIKQKAYETENDTLS